MKKVLFIIICLLIFPSIAFAETAEIKVECPNSNKKKEKITCEVKANFSYEINAIDYKFSYNDKEFTFIEFKPEEGWELLGEGTNIGLLTTENQKGEFRIGTMIFEAKVKNANPNVKNERISVSDSEFNNIDVLDETNNVNESKKYNLKKATTSNNHLKYDIIIIIVVIVVLIIMMGLVIYKIIRSDTK